MIDLARSNSIFISLRTNVNIMIETTQSSILWTYGFLRDRSVLQFYNFDQFCVQAVCISACRFVGLWMRNFYYGVFGWAFGLFRTSSWKPGQFKGPRYTIWEFADWMRTQFSFNKLHACMVFGPVSLMIWAISFSTYSELPELPALFGGCLGKRRECGTSLRTAAEIHSFVLNKWSWKSAFQWICV